MREGKLEEAKKAVNKYYDVMPTRFYGMRSMMGTYFMAENLYILHETARANALIEKSAAYIEKELGYLADVSQSKNKFVGGQNVQLGMSFLNQMARTAEQNKQTKLSGELTNKFKALEMRFGPYLQQ